MKICFVHDWLTTYGGAELVLKVLLEIWPETPIFTLVADPTGQCREIIESTTVHTSFIQKLPFARRHHRAFLPLMPLAVEQFDLSAYDLVISGSHAVAKGVLTGPDQLHISYVYTPIRYAWDLQHQYLEQAGLTRGIRGWLVKSLLHYIRLWDLRTAPGVDEFIAISHFIARRIKKIYRRDAGMIYPPVELERFHASPTREDYYVTVSRLVAYKKVNLIVDAFTQMPDKKLVVIGTGPELPRLQKAAGPNITFTGYQDHAAVADWLSKARAFIYAAEEDFGIVPVEAQASGTPVIAYGKGGALETVVPGKTGFFFAEQTASALVSAVQRFELHPPLDAAFICQHAKQFSKERFQQEMKAFVEQTYNHFFQHSISDEETPGSDGRKITA